MLSLAGIEFRFGRVSCLCSFRCWLYSLLFCCCSVRFLLGKGGIVVLCDIFSFSVFFLVVSGVFVFHVVRYMFCPFPSASRNK